MKKRIISMLLTVLMVMSLFSGLSLNAYAATTTGANTIQYTMAAGDYVLRICQKLGLNYYTCKDAIMILNNIYDGQWNKLTVGRTLTLPASDADAVLIANGASLSNVNSGATASTVSAVYNSGTATTGTSVATTATFKAASTADSLAYYLVPYTMSSGENVSGVCNGLGVNFSIFSPFIKQVNGISDWTKVRAGQTLLIPTPVCPSVGTSCYGVMQHMVNGSDTAYGIVTSNGVNYNANKTLLEVLNQTSNLGAISSGSWFYYPVPLTVSVAGTGNPGSTVTTTTTTTSTDGNGTTTTTSTTTAKLYKLTGGMSASDGAMLFYVDSKPVTAAPAGAKVTIVSETYSGKAIQSLTVKHANGTADLHLTGDTFIMPSCDVRVDCEIKTGHDINITANYSNKACATFNGITVMSAVKNEAIVIKSNDPNYEISAVYAYYRKLISSSTKTALTVSSSHAFIMPDADVDVEVVLKPVATYAFYVNEVTPESGSFYLEVDGSPVTRAAKGATVTVVTKSNEGYEPSKLTVTKHGTSQAVNVFSNTFTMPGFDVDVSVEFTAKGNNILIMPTQIAAVYAFEEGSVPASVIASPSDLDIAIEETGTGNRFCLVAVNVDDPDNPFDIDDADYTITYDVVRNSDGLKVKEESSAPTTGLLNYSKWYKMPKGGVTVTPVITAKSKVPVAGEIYRSDYTDSFGNLKKADKYLDCSFSVTYKDGTKERRVEFTGKGDKNPLINSFEYVDLRYDVADGVAFIRYEIDVTGTDADKVKELKEMLTNEANLNGYFQIPDANDVKRITIKAYFETGKVAIGPAVYTGIGTVGYKDKDGKSINSCNPGDTVYLSVYWGNGYHFDDAKYKDKLIITRKDNGARIEVKKPAGDNRIFDSAGKHIGYTYYFENMPASGVDVQAIFDAKPFTITMTCIDETGAALTGQGLWQIAINWVPGVVDDWTQIENGKVVTKFEVAYEDYVTVAMTEAGWSKYDMVSFRIDSKEYTAEELNYFYNFQMIEERAKNLDIVAVLRPRVPYSVAIHNLTAVYDYAKGSVGFLILESSTGYSREYLSQVDGTGKLVSSQYVNKAFTGDKIAIAASIYDGKYTIKANDIVLTSYTGDEDRIVAKEEYFTVDDKLTKFFTFIMPDSDVVASIPFSGEKYSLKIVVRDEDGNPVGGMVNLTAGAQTFGDAAADDSFGQIEYNTLISIMRSYLAVSENKHVTKVDVKTDPGKDPVYYYNYSSNLGGNGPTFYMPASNVIVYITVDDYVPATYITFQKSLDGGTLKFLSGSSKASPEVKEADLEVGDEIYVLEFPNSDKGHLGKGDLRITNNGQVYTVANWYTELSDGTNVWKVKVPNGLTTFTAVWPDKDAETSVDNPVYAAESAGGTLTFLKGDAATPTLKFTPGEKLYIVATPNAGYDAPALEDIFAVDKDGKLLTVKKDSHGFYIDGSEITSGTEAIYVSADFKAGDKIISFEVKTADTSAYLVLSDGRTATITAAAGIVNYELPVGTIVTVTSATDGYDDVILSATAGTISGTQYMVPAENAKLEITLKPAANPIKWITENGSLEFEIIAPTEHVKAHVVSADIKDTIKITAKPNTNYNQLEAEYLRVLKLADASTVNVVSAGDDGHGTTYWTFEMPAGGVYVGASFGANTQAKVEFKPNQKANLTIDGLGTAVVDKGKTGTYYLTVGTVVTVAAAEDGYDKVTITADKGIVKDNTYTVTDDGATVKITLSSSSNLITKKNLTTGEVLFYSDKAMTKAIGNADTDATVYVKAAAVDGYTSPSYPQDNSTPIDLDAWKEIIKITRKTDGTTVDLVKETPAKNQARLSFVMPAGGVDVTAEFPRKAITYTVKIINTVSGAPSTVNVRVTDGVSGSTSVTTVTSGSVITAYVKDKITVSTSKSGYAASLNAANTTKGSSAISSGVYTVPAFSTSTADLGVNYAEGTSYDIYEYFTSEEGEAASNDADAETIEDEDGIEYEVVTENEDLPEYEDDIEYEEVSEEADLPEYEAEPANSEAADQGEEPNA